MVIKSRRPLCLHKDKSDIEKTVEFQQISNGVYVGHEMIIDDDRQAIDPSVVAGTDSQIIRIE